ncbi:MAG: carboxypeptidase-like regulatory domain-containing protein [Tannerellaceae bacterium]|nr:carboxypeptidase-like regulatory domain-containing protein [Tannerellaceae bacterium]MCD8265076.1 carboxypeptidase-like regulatory domain-containing protein [Tannerellaceae bacterium]
MKLYKLLIGIVVFHANILCAQSNFRITGNIIEAKGGKEPVEFANVSLTTLDSIFVAGTISGHRGSFIISNLQQGDYILTASYMGFTSTTLRIDNFSASIDLGDLLLEEASVELTGIIVKASSTSTQLDRKLFFLPLNNLPALPME